MIARLAGCAFLIAVFAARDVRAQSTSSLGHPERPVTVEVSVGFEPGENGYAGDNSSKNAMRGAAVALRWNEGRLGGFRLAAVALQRESGERYLYQQRVLYESDRTNRVLAIAVTASPVLRVWHDLTLEPSVGGGVAPFAFVDQKTQRGDAAGSNPPDDTYANTSVAGLWTAGLALRYRSVVVSYQSYILQGSVRALAHKGDYHPLSVGWRF